MIMVLAFCLSVLLARTFVIQIVLGADACYSAISQRSSPFPLETARGQILDRNLVPLTDPRTRQVLVIFPESARSAVTVDALSGVLDEESLLLVPELMQKAGASGRPATMELPVGGARLARERLQDTSLGLAVVPLTLRYGPRSVARHIVGHIIEADNAGMSGLEKRFDSVGFGPGLKGRWPRSVAPVRDGVRDVISGLGYRELSPTERSSVVLTIDVRAQRAVEQVLQQHKVEKGAAIVLDVSTGEVLAMASRPEFDQNDLAASIGDPRAPLINRAVEAFYPGSVFKLATACAALETGAANPSELTVCPGYLDVGGSEPIRCTHHTSGPQIVTLRDAMAYSCNPVFVALAQRTGDQPILECARRLGFGVKWREALEGASGYVTQPASLRALANLAIGQEYVKVTPLQMTQAVATMASGGIMRPAYLVKQMVDQNGRTVRSFDPPRAHRVVSASTAQTITRWLEACVSYGTGQAAAVPGGAGGKTGTPESAGSTLVREVWDAWFVGFAPVPKPRYAVGVFIEEGMSGPHRAAPVFAQIAKAILELENR
jgi:cell division protein FtsI/penicillin-binding protein 2